VRNFFAVAVVAVVFVYYSFPTFTTDGFCNSTTADIGVVLTIASSTSSGSRIIRINCDAGYSLIENTLFLTVAVVATVGVCLTNQLKLLPIQPRCISRKWGRERRRSF
jgi:hypothetical protein